MKKRLLLLSFATVVGLSGCGQTNMNMNMNHKSHQAMNNEKTPALNANTQVDFTFKGTPQSGKSTSLTMQVTNKNGQPIKEFDIEHTKLMHLIVVSKDLSFFEHIHPDYKGNGLFTVTPTFPSGGEYKLFADFVPKGESKSINTTVVNVVGNKVNPTSLKEDKVLTKVVDDKEVTLKFDHLMTGMDLNMTFTIKDAKTKKPISNLQPYLGAVGHVVAISSDTETYLHVHPMDEKATGPNAVFMTNFPKSGLYKIWGQFQHNGKLFIVPFTVNVPK